jgi:signal peptidase I
MTSIETHAPPPSPWLSMWFKPGDTIERVVAMNPRHHVLLLAALGAISNLVLQLIDFRRTIELPNWQILAGVVLGGAIIGVVSLYISGLMFRWAGNIFGGRAPAVQLRAAIAWGTVPAVLMLAINLIVLIVLMPNSANVPRVAQPPIVVLQAIAAALSLWSVIATFLMLKRLQGFGIWRAIASSVLGWTLILVFPLLIRTFLFQTFSIPSGALNPTLLVGDYFLASKFSYGYTRFSLPFSPPLFSGRIFASEPQRGDVVVFRRPKDPTTDYVQRVVGLPGDRIQMINGLLHINGTPVQRVQIEDFIKTDESGRATRVKQWRETLPNGVSYATIDLIDNGFYDNTSVYVVPSGHYFMMGDNRDNSTDSRVLSAVGYIPFENIIGRAQTIFWSIDPNGRIRFERLGMKVQ